jgi:hypothetical protein
MHKLTARQILEDIHQAYSLWIGLYSSFIPSHNVCIALQKVHLHAVISPLPLQVNQF